MDNQPEAQIVDPPPFAPKSKRNFYIIIVVLLLTIFSAGGLFLGKTLRLPQNPDKPVPTITNTPKPADIIILSPFPSPTPDLFADWKKYISNTELFLFLYPSNYKLEEYEKYIAVYYINPMAEAEDDDYLKMEIILDAANTGQTVEAYSDQLIQSTKESTGQYNVYNKRKIKLGSIDAIRWQWKGREDGEIVIAIYQNTTFMIRKFPLLSKKQDEFEQILSTFKFLSQEESEGKFCGGIANLPCPAGYSCELSGSYPDAGGKCVKSERANSKEECLAQEGTWQKWGLMQKEYCQIPAADADKSCTDGSQCSYGTCMSERGSVPGKCARYKNTFGCYSTIQNGKSTNAMCVD